jgi:Xaa-Pro aminopeptidase
MNKFGSFFESGEIDALLLTDGASKYYFSQYSASFSFLLLTKRERFFITDKRYSEEAEQVLTDFSVVALKEKADLENRIVEILKSQDIKKLGFEDEAVSYKTYQFLRKIADDCNVELLPSSLFLAASRAKKSEIELEKIKKAAEIAKISFLDTLKLLKEGVSEAEIASELEYKMRKMGADGAAFSSVVAFGENTSKPHCHFGKRKLKKGDIVLVDCGAVFEGYRSDMTRVAAFGRASEEVKKVYEAVKNAGDAAIEMIKEGVTFNELDAKAKEVLGDLAEFFTHSLGHGVGLNIHEYPSQKHEHEKPLLKGSVITIEPAVYLPKKFGIRVEDMLLVTENGSENLTNLDRNLIML